MEDPWANECIGGNSRDDAVRLHGKVSVTRWEFNDNLQDR